MVSLWLDVFQKIRALGYNGVSVYWHWALLEGKRGDFSAEGIFALEPFFEAAMKAGIYILARPGPYINAEASGGGYPGWLQRDAGKLRTRDPRYLEATENYVASMSKIISKYQITEGGPVILLQPENEYSQATADTPEFPDSVYWEAVEAQYRKGGITVPFISNDAHAHGFFAPGPPQRYAAAVDIYGHDGYPLRFDCANPYKWPDGIFPTYYLNDHINQSSSTPFSLVEFQGGSFDPWGGPGFDKCLALLGSEFERVFYKNDFSFGVTIFNVYMTYGGTNWGNLGHPGGYTSYDYGAVITEERLVHREKYSQAKLLASFLQASPAYLTAVAQNNSHANGSYTGNEAIATTAVLGNVTNFFVVRHAVYNTFDSTEYTITLPTSKGNITVPQLGGSLSLHGRDSKIYVTDYDVGGSNLLYSTAEIFTRKKYGEKTVLVLYTGPDETNEIAVLGSVTVTKGDGIDQADKDGVTVLKFATSPTQRVVTFSNGLTIYIVDRQTAYTFWTADTQYTPQVSSPIIVGPYLVRSAKVDGSSMHIVGDLNQTSPLTILGGAPDPLLKLTFNGKSIPFAQEDGVVMAKAVYTKPSFNIPDLSTIGWKVLDSLPEIQPDYDDSAWPNADLTYSNNTARNLTTPTSLYSSDYGFHTGTLLYRGHFTCTGQETTFFLSTQGGSAFGHSVWLNNLFLGSFPGADLYENWNATYPLPTASCPPGQPSILTVIIDNMGLDENGRAGDTEMKNPRGILDYDLLPSHDKTSIKWKLTGNLGGEAFHDRVRGPLNEGGLFAERQGFHLPHPPTSSPLWHNSRLGPMQGLEKPGVAFYSTTFELHMPSGYDVPLEFEFTNSSTSSSSPSSSSATGNANVTLATPYRVQIYVNGYQFGKYVHNIGPQDTFPVPEGIFNFHGRNFLAVSLWALDGQGAKVEGLRLRSKGMVVQTGMERVRNSPFGRWRGRRGAY